MTLKELIHADLNLVVIDDRSFWYRVQGIEYRVLPTHPADCQLPLHTAYYNTVAPAFNFSPFIWPQPRRHVFNFQLSSFQLSQICRSLTAN
jgi:hypothetical protein